MKKIEAFLRPEVLEEIKIELGKVGINGLSISEVNGYGNQKGWKEYVRGTEVDYNFLPKIKVEIVAIDAQVESIVKTIVAVAKTGEVGDGKIFISTIDDAIRIRTGETGEAAVK